MYESLGCQGDEREHGERRETAAAVESLAWEDWQKLAVEHPPEIS